ncbi:growth-regulating factor 6-like [Humulus lupulus]|uniref:growth-regulating factor 6-like n=1 Tax=Humulus lupulus TaxID=3486 RepID=UPI002B410C31|nr:growth-regulating factor 6-like [Humulus lupulus]
MDFGMVMGLDYGSGAISESAAGFGSLSSSSTTDPEPKHRLYGSGKQERSAAASSSSTGLDEYWRSSSKVAKTTDDFSYCKLGMVQLQGQRNASSPVLRSNCNGQQQQMLSFSSPKSEALMVDKSSSQNNATLLPCNYPNAFLSAYTRNTGYNSGGLNLNGGNNMYGAIIGAKGPFTPSQWMELEQQALIYKYITANVAIPSNLLIPIRKAIDSSGLSHFPGGILRANTLGGWGSFHLGFSNNADPEPGRCRRTDGKKWRCSRDAVADQKYCERHMNRGRHRSRKPVEGQTGHSVAGATANANATASKLMPLASSSPSSTSVAVSGAGGSSNSLAISNHHLLQQQNTSATTHLNRMQQQNTLGLSLLSKDQNAFLTQSFGLVASDSLLNLAQKNTEARNHQQQQHQQQQHSLRHFIDDWPKTQPNRQALSWPEIDIQTDRTQLSISMPLASSDLFIPSSSSPEKTSLSMSLGVGAGEHVGNRNWIPIAWENSLMGGPLGEVLHHSNSSNNNNNGSVECKNSSSSSSVLNLMTEGWDNSPPMGSSSPTGVLQKTAFGSLSNSSAGSSPRGENNKSLD